MQDVAKYHNVKYVCGLHFRIEDYQTPDEHAHVDNVKEDICSEMRKLVNFSWLTGEWGCSSHGCQIHDGIIRGVCAISLPWWCTKNNRTRANQYRQRSAARKLKKLQHI